MSLTKGLLHAMMAFALAGCNAQSEIDSNFLSNLNPTSSPVPTASPFTTNFSFAAANSAQYNFDSTKIDFSNGYAELTSSSQTDQSNVAAGFAGGSSTGVTWDSANGDLRLDAATAVSTGTALYSGTFTSRVMDGLSTTANWTQFTWTPTLPFFKELPDSSDPANPVSETQADYSSQSASLMNGIAGLWHLDEGLGTNGVNSVLDASGNGNDGTPVNVIFNSAGKLQTAASFDGNSSVITAAVPTQLGNTDVTLAVWVYINSTSDQGAFIKIGNSTNFGGGDGFALGVGGTQMDNSGNNLLGLFEGVRWINTATSLGTGWIHVAMVIDHSGTPSFFINGTAVAGAFAGALAAVPSSGQNLNLGGYTSSSATNRHFAGKLDEMAVWSRALNPAEVLGLYRRGANRIKFQIRTCADSTCSANPSWEGPDNTNQTYFSELNNTASNTSGAVQAGLPTMTFANFSGLTIPTNRYFQYRAIMESDDTSLNCNYGSGATWCSPELKVASVGPGHFDTTAPSITNKAGASYDDLTNWVETIDSNGCGSGTLYNISPNNANWYYWTGAAWGLSDGTVSKANPATTITTHLSTFATQVGTGTVYFKVFLQSNGTSACAIDSLSISGAH